MPSSPSCLHRDSIHNNSRLLGLWYQREDLARVKWRLAPSQLDFSLVLCFQIQIHLKDRRTLMPNIWSLYELCNDCDDVCRIYLQWRFICNTYLQQCQIWEAHIQCNWYGTQWFWPQHEHDMLQIFWVYEARLHDICQQAQTPQGLDWDTNRHCWLLAQLKKAWWSNWQGLLSAIVIQWPFVKHFCGELSNCSIFLRSVSS